MTQVKLRSKLISGGKRSLFLDYYPPIPHPITQKKIRWEFLKLYINVKCKTELEKTHNKETTALAETIRARRQIEVQNEHFDFISVSKHDNNFLEYFQELLDKKDEKNKGILVCTLTYLKKFRGTNIRFSDINAKFCNDFKEFILKAYRIRSRETLILQNTAHSYFNCLKAALTRAYKDGLLKTDISSQVERIKNIETQRQFLTIEELNKLIRTDCESPLLKKASLFSSLTGQRFSDIEKLKWSEVHPDIDKKGNRIYSLHFIQQKTKGVEVLPISKQAYDLLGERRDENENVFIGLEYSSALNLILKQWVLDAGITKKITFHCFRHTFATLQLSMGTDIYTISKMLGHRNIQTTQIYVKSLDIDKRKAANMIQLDFGINISL